MPNGEDEKWKSVALMLVVGNICVFGGHSYAAAHPGGAARRPARATPGASSLAKARERVASDQTGHLPQESEWKPKHLKDYYNAAAVDYDIEALPACAKEVVVCETSV